jgi:hypothetical protein
MDKQVVHVGTAGLFIGFCGKTGETLLVDEDSERVQAIE